MDAIRSNIWAARAAALLRDHGTAARRHSEAGRLLKERGELGPARTQYLRAVKHLLRLEDINRVSDPGLASLMLGIADANLGKIIEINSALRTLSILYSPASPAASKRA
ncbi:MAG: hypothetical protein ABSE71_03615 [Candidatus Micrarchaeaceae archaeon]|jgi:hypothetical protein|nr:hypothetical protein [Candidatus Micrarchaeota archaeon]HII09788.1 hypothetical protein [Candidatus Micrarchaeota archaeon]